MKFLIPLKKDLRVLPPLVSLIRGLAELDHQVELFGYHFSPESTQSFPANRVNVTAVSSSPYPIGAPRWKRVVETTRAYRALSRLLGDVNDIDILWRGTTDYRYLHRVLRRHGVRLPVVFQFHEHDPDYFHLCRTADHVVVPEENRAWLTRVSAGLSYTPSVLPNTPIHHPRRVDPSAIDTQLSQHRESGKRIVMYQGGIDFQRRCIKELIQAIGLCDSDTVLAMMPARPLVEEDASRISVIAKDSNVADRVVILPTRVAPTHLDIIGQADVGIGLYRPTSINQIYCAPNRLYEFTGFGIPVVLPNFPGIRQIGDKYGCIELCDPQSPASIANAIESFARQGRRECATESAHSFFESEGNYLQHLENLITKLVEED